MPNFPDYLNIKDASMHYNLAPANQSVGDIDALELLNKLNTLTQYNTWTIDAREPTEEEFNWLRCLTDQRKYNLYYRVSDMNSGASVSWVQVNPEITGTDLNSLKHYLQGLIAGYPMGWADAKAEVNATLGPLAWDASK